MLRFILVYILLIFSQTTTAYKLAQILSKCDFGERKTCSWNFAKNIDDFQNYSSNPLQLNISPCSSRFTPQFLLFNIKTWQAEGCMRFLIKKQEKVPLNVQLNLKIKNAHKTLFISNKLTSALNHEHMFYLDLKPSSSKIQVFVQICNLKDMDEIYFIEDLLFDETRNCFPYKNKRMERELIADLVFKDDPLKIDKISKHKISTNKSNLINFLLRSNDKNLDAIRQKEMIHKSSKTISYKSVLPNDLLNMLKFSQDDLFFVGLGIIAIVLLLTIVIFCLIVKRKRAQIRLYDRFYENRFLSSSDRTLNSTLSDSSQSDSNGIQLINYEKRSSSLKMQQLASINESSNEFAKQECSNNKVPDKLKMKNNLFKFRFFNKKPVSLEDTYL